jgi:hypothetical protein
VAENEVIPLTWLYLSLTMPLFYRSVDSDWQVPHNTIRASPI